MLPADKNISELRATIASFVELKLVAFKRHALQRMLERTIKIDEVLETLNNGKIIEVYPGDRPLLSLLMLGYTADGRPLHLVVAIDEDEPRLWLITVYQPNESDWEAGFIVRRNTL